jgi:hypothetical protein
LLQHHPHPLLFHHLQVITFSSLTTDLTLKLGVEEEGEEEGGFMPSEEGVMFELPPSQYEEEYPEEEGVAPTPAVPEEGELYSH